MIRSTRAAAFVLVLGAAALLPLIAASCQKVIGLPDNKPTYVGGAGAQKPVNASQKCKDYCALATTTCVADPADAGKGMIYANENSCLMFCTKLEGKDYEFTVGASEALMDPIDCRVTPLQSPENLSTACAQASPTGSAECGNMCELYCKLYRDVCAQTCADNPSTCTLPPKDDCQRQCESMRVDGQTLSLPGGTYDQVANYEGDSLQCRFLHLVNAIGDARGHCGHAAFNSNAHCFDDPNAENPVPLTCEAYCRIVEGACPAAGEFGVYESGGQCMAVCGAMTDAGLLGENRDGAYTADLKPPEDSPNTIGCRHTHSYFAFSNPADHCSHAGPLGAPACAESCESFCVLKQQACPSTQTTENCMTDCAKIEGVNKPPDYTVAAAKKGGDFNCRVLHLVRALEPKADKKSECAIVNGATCPAE